MLYQHTNSPLYGGFSDFGNGLLFVSATKVNNVPSNHVVRFVGIEITSNLPIVSNSADGSNFWLVFIYLFFFFMFLFLFLFKGNVKHTHTHTHTQIVKYSNSIEKQIWWFSKQTQSEMHRSRSNRCMWCYTYVTFLGGKLSYFNNPLNFQNIHYFQTKMKNMIH